MKSSIDSIRSQATATEVSFSLKADYVTKIYGPYEHPASQCRLDTLVAGTLNAPRPDCWYNPDALFWAF